MKVRDIPYKRYAIEEFEAVLEREKAAVKSAKSAAEIAESRKRVEAARVAFVTADDLAYCRYTLNTHDPFYSAEHDYYSEVSPRAENLIAEYGNLLLDSPFRADLEKMLNPLVFRHMELARKSVSPATVDDMREENALVTEYSDFMSQFTVNFHGEEMPLSVLRREMKHSDRAVRRAAYEALGKRMEESASDFDGIFDRLVRVRDRMARKLGMQNFTELGYARMDRVCFGREDAERFRENIRKEVVPAVARVKRRIADALGIGKFMLYDNEVYVPGGDPEPRGDILGKAAEMYREMHPEIGEFFRGMIEADAFDVESREGKWGGGYCTNFPAYRQPFILANFNGTSADVDVVTHEVGHAYADYECFRHSPEILDLAVGGMETAETHSMSMEFFCWKYMDKFFGADADKYRYLHLADAFAFLPYGTAVDEFQHRVYDDPEMSPEERNAVWRELEKTYRPWLSADGIPYLERGTRWQYQMHIYETPFYYIDYCLAQTAAIGFLFASRKDYAAALEKYRAFVVRGGQDTFTDLLRAAGLPSPFEEGALGELARRTEELINELFSNLHITVQAHKCN